MGWLSEGVDAVDAVDAADAERVLARPPAVEKSRMLEAMGRGDPSAIEDIAAALRDEAAMGDIIDDSDGPGADTDRNEGVEGVPECRWKFVCPASTSNGLPTPRLQPPPSATDLAGFPDSSTRPLAGEDDPNPKLVPGPPGADDIDDLPTGPFPGFITGSVLAILLSGKPNPKSSFRVGFTPEVADTDPDVDDEELDDGPEEDDLGDDGLSSALALSRPSDLLARTSFSDNGLASSESLESTMGLGSAIP